MPKLAARAMVATVAVHAFHLLQGRQYVAMASDAILTFDSRASGPRR